MGRSEVSYFHLSLCSRTYNREISLASSLGSVTGFSGAARCLVAAKLSGSRFPSPPLFPFLISPHEGKKEAPLPSLTVNSRIPQPDWSISQPPLSTPSILHHDLWSVWSHIEFDRRLVDCRGRSMSLPGPNVRLSLDSRHFAWPHLLRDPDPPTATADCLAGRPCRQWGGQGQRHRKNQQFQLARNQRCQQPGPSAAGSYEPPRTITPARQLASSDQSADRICMFSPAVLGRMSIPSGKHISLF